MCGIVGYTGEKNAIDILIDGLKRLEYRGYDSAGIAVGNGDLQSVHAVGKVKELAARIKKDKLGSFKSGIAHTRWATHGPPTEENAHPHSDNSGDFAVVHNGIIENYQAIREMLTEQGCNFTSETDSEVLPHLIAQFYDGDLTAAVAAALKKVEGTYGIAVMAKAHPGELVAARKGSPIVIGVGDHETLIASDISAIVAHTSNVIFLDDDDIAHVTANNVQLRNIDNVPVSRKVSTIDWDIDAVEKGGYDHFMLKEIFEQPDALKNAIRGRLDHPNGSAILSGLNMTPQDIGTINRVIIAISQSGETADTLAALREAKMKGAQVMGLCNVVGSTIAREAGRGIYLHAGPEIGVASTKAFTCQVSVLLMMALKFARAHRMTRQTGVELAQEIETIPDLVKEVLKRAPDIEKIAKKFADCEDWFFIGRGYLYPVALEGALKLKEISYQHAEGYNAAELKHGPIALLEEKVPVVALANDIDGKDKMIGNIEECLARKSPVILTATEGDDSLKSYTDDIIWIPECSKYVCPILVAVALQLLSYYVARERGEDIDQPRNLAKSVTVE